MDDEETMYEKKPKSRSARTLSSWLGVLGMCISFSACDCRGGMQQQPADMSVAGDPDMSSGPDDMMSVVLVPEGPMAGRTAMRLLTRYEYDQTVSDLLGVTSIEAQQFPPENTADGFENNAWIHKVNPTTLRYYMEASERLSTEAYASPPAELVPCVPAQEGAEVDTNACKAGFESFIYRAFRRPVKQDEVAIIHGLYDTFLEEEGVEQAFKVSLQGVLQAPQFLYRVELYEASPVTLPPRDGEMTPEDFELVGPYEMASRLSYFFWGTMPDEELLELAGQGQLNTPEVLEAQVTRMLSDARSRRMVYQFHRQWLGLDRLASLGKDKAIYPEWNLALRDDFRASLDAFVEHAYWEEGSFEALMTSSTVYLTPAMASLYGEEVPADHGGLWKAQMPADQRKGLLTQPAILSMLAYANQSSPIARAIFVREKLLCQHLPPPPSDQDITPPDPDPGLTTREVFAIHTEQETCASCHLLIDPLGFGMEDFDGLGRKRTTENNRPVDSSGELVNSPDSSINGEFDGAVELAALIAGSEKIPECLAEQWFTFAMGRHSDKSDEASFTQIRERFKESGYRFNALFQAIVLSDSFRYRKKKEIADMEAMGSTGDEEAGQ